MRSLALVMSLSAAAFAGEQPVHWNSKNKPVVVLADRDRSDPEEYRYVLVNARHEEYCLVVDRHDGRIWLCDQRAGNEVRYNSQGQILLGSCAQVYDGPVLVRGK